MIFPSVGVACWSFCRDEDGGACICLSFAIAQCLQLFVIVSRLEHRCRSEAWVLCLYGAACHVMPVKRARADHRCPCRTQVKTLGYWGGTSFLFSFFKWFFTASSDNVSCGFSSWPSLGVDALAYNWNFDFSLTYIGVGAYLIGISAPCRYFACDPCCTSGFTGRCLIRCSAHLVNNRGKPTSATC